MGAIEGDEIGSYGRKRWPPAFANGRRYLAESVTKHINESPAATLKAHFVTSAPE
jgi:hypothetical protein